MNAEWPYPLRDPVPEDKESCDACSYPTQHLHKTNPPFMSKRTEPYWFCDLCWTSFAGNAAQYPGQYEDGRVLQHICFVGNVILAEIRKGRLK